MTRPYLITTFLGVLLALTSCDQNDKKKPSSKSDNQNSEEIPQPLQEAQGSLGISGNTYFTRSVPTEVAAKTSIPLFKIGSKQVYLRWVPADSGRAMGKAWTWDFDTDLKRNDKYVVIRHLGERFVIENQNGRWSLPPISCHFSESGSAYTWERTTERLTYTYDKNGRLKKWTFPEGTLNFSNHVLGGVESWYT